MYDIDCDDPDLLRVRSWRWMQNRILGLITRPPRYSPDGRVIHSTRLGLALHPPTEPAEG